MSMERLDSTRMDVEMKMNNGLIGAIESPQFLNQDPQQNSPTTQKTLQIAVSATFTAESLAHPLKFWMDTLNIPGEVVMAPYAQVMQQLLDQQSAFSVNRTGCNI